MKPLILTSNLTHEFVRSGRAALAVDFFFRFVWGPLPPLGELSTAYLGVRTPTHGPGHHWSDFAAEWGQSKSRDCRDLGLAEFCQQYETVELWFAPDPNAQLLQVWLLDYFRSHPKTVARLKLRLIDREMSGIRQFDKRIAPTVEVSQKEIATASAAWQAYQATTPADCVDLLDRDLSALPLLRPALADLLKELPSRSTGLGATEMRMLEMIAAGCAGTNALFQLGNLGGTRIFGESEHGYLLEGLSHGPRPAVAGLDDELRTLGRENPRARQQAYRRSELSLTEFGEAIVAREEDFSRHNPIDRWWGGTRLTNDRLWTYDQMLVKPKRRRRAP